MSRSYKYPVWKDHGKHVKYNKRISNKKIRRYLKTLTKGLKTNRLRLLEDPWNICDWKFYPDKEEDIKKASRK